MFKYVIYSAVIVLSVQVSLCMDLEFDWHDMAASSGHFQGELAISDFFEDSQQELVAIHYDDTLQQHRLFCSTDKRQIIDALISYHLLEAQCTCATAQRTNALAHYSAEFDPLIVMHKEGSSLLCNIEGCCYTAAASTPAHVKLKMIVHKTLAHSIDTYTRSFVQGVTPTLISASDGCLSQGRLMLLRPVATAECEQYILYLGTSERAVMQRYFKNSIETGAYNQESLKSLKKVLNQGTASQQKVQQGHLRKRLFCPQKGCKYTVHGEVTKDSCKPLLIQLLRHFALCKLLSDVTNPEYRKVANCIGVSFEDARHKLRNQP